MQISKRTFAAVAVAIVLGAVAATARSAVFSGDAIPVGAASADVHCTRYVPSTAVDVNCGQGASISIVGGCTNSSALRDDDWFSTSNTVYFELYYQDNDCSHSANTWGDTNGNASYYSIGSSGGYAWATCLIDSTSFGQCTTDWHT